LTEVGQARPSSLRLPALVLVLLALLPLTISLATKRQLFALGGLTDNWIYLGANLRVSGVLGEEKLPLVLRAPGYPLFLAGIFEVALEKPPGVTYDYMLRGAGVVYAAQALLLAVSGLLLFLWLASFVARTTAFAAGLTLATSPHAVVLAGLAHYSVLHIFLVVAGGWALHRLLRDASPNAGRALGAGLLWGCATLVRSTTLILPAFALGLFWMRWRDVRRSLRAVLWFAAGMCVAIAPATLRNYRVAHRFVPVNLQAGAAIWGSTVKVLPGDADSYRWFELSDEFMRIFVRVTGQPQYDYAVYARHHLEIEDAMWAEALANLRSDPRPYLVNGLRTLRTLCLDTSSILIRVFRYSQPPRPLVDQFWFRGTQARELLPAAPATGYVRLGALLTGLAWFGVALASYRRDALALAPAVVFGCLVSAHALTYMDLLYYYVRLPFVAFLSFYGLEGLAALAPARARPTALLASRLAALLICGASLLLTAQLLSS
jgi:hypothetical protein